ncbi:hypothetical protein EON77_13735 [bacterium]|nr:MAG: hypothetical protein EON77_13735 [bacterium]
MNASLRWLACAFVAVAGLQGCKPQRSETATSVSGPDAVLGLWVPDATPRALLTAGGTAPPLNEEAARIYDDRRRRLSAGDASFDPTTWCAGPGMPRILTLPTAFEIRRDGDRVAFIHDWYRWFRVVDLTPGEVDPPLPLTLGFPVGRWDGDALVIETVGLIDSTVMDASGLPHSEQLKLTEHLRVLPDGRLENRILVDDPETFTAPWETVLTFHHDADARIRDDVCPDRLAKGEPAEPARGSPSAAVAPTVDATPAKVTAASSAAIPRLSGLWEPRTFGFMVPDAPLSPPGLDIVDRNAAAMKSGRIMQTAWTSCRPGAVSTMTMPREKIVILQSADEITLLFEMPRMVRRIRLGISNSSVISSAD